MPETMTDPYASRCAPHPRVRSRHDPVVYGQWTERAPLTRAQVDQFDSQGFLIMHDVFDEDEVALLQAEVGALLADPTGLDARTMITEPGGDEIRSIFEIHQQNPLMARLSADERLAGVARFLLDDDVYVHQSRLNYKPGYKGKEFFWHSDFETWHMEDGMPRMRAISASVLLAANTAHNGPLMLMPGSHRNFLACVGETPDDHYLISLKKQEYGVPDESSLAEFADAHGIVAALGDPGTVVLFDCNMMHGSNGNITPYPRANAFIVFNAVSNRLMSPFGSKAPRPSFIASRQAEPVQPMKGRLG